jgi:phage terminase small subunit
MCHNVVGDGEMTDKPLSIKHSKFVDEYLRCFNGTQAYLLVYPKATYESAKANAARLLTNDNVKAEITSRLAEAHMTADEALKRLADMARSDVTEFLTPFGAVDLDAVKAAGKGHLIKKIKQRTITKIGKGRDEADTETHDTEIELYSAKDAIDTILKVGGKLKDSNLVINVNLTDD